MSDRNDSSDKTGQTFRDIRALAFSGDLLALNAAVAAAGGGRPAGFADPAEAEAVRSLADPGRLALAESASPEVSVPAMVRPASRAPRNPSDLAVLEQVLRRNGLPSGQPETAF